MSIPRHGATAHFHSVGASTPLSQAEASGAARPAAAAAAGRAALAQQAPESGDGKTLRERSAAVTVLPSSAALVRQVAEGLALAGSGSAQALAAAFEQVGRSASALHGGLVPQGALRSIVDQVQRDGKGPASEQQLAIFHALAAGLPGDSGQRSQLVAALIKSGAMTPRQAIEAFGNG